MSELGFEVRSRDHLPVDVYDSDFLLVRRTLSSDRIAVDPGTYFVVGRLPDGSELHTTVEVAASGPASARLGPGAVEDDLDLDLDDLDELDELDLDFDLGEPELLELEDSELDDSLEDSELDELDVDLDEPDLDAASRGSPRGAPRRPEKAAARAGVPARVQGHQRHPSGHWRQTRRRSAGRLPVHLAIMGPVDALELQQPDGSTAWVRIPRRAAGYVAVALGPGRDGRVRLAARLEHHAARALLDYVDAGLLADAALLAGSPEVTAERLLKEKRRDPVAAAAAAFVLLRLGELERLHNWTSNLGRMFGWLPDGLVARAEHAALEGHHDEALELLRRLPERGLPVLSMGLAYAVDRLRTYVRLNPRDEGLRQQLDELARYALATDFAQPVTTFTGAGPESPRPYSPTPRAGGG